MVNIYCYTWNLFLPPQGLADSTCGYHAIKNGNLMLKILREGDYSEFSYIDDIKKNKNYKKLISKNYFDNQLLKYESYYKSHLLSRGNMKHIMKSCNMEKNIFIVYLEHKKIFESNEYPKIKEILKQKSYKICIIFFKKRLEIITHWVPIVFDKKNDNVHMHILDSYDMSWWGDENLNQLVNILYPNANINCNDEYYQGNFYYFIYKSIELIVLIIIIYLFMNGCMKKIKN